MVVVRWHVMATASQPSVNTPTVSHFQVEFKRACMSVEAVSSERHRNQRSLLPSPDWTGLAVGSPRRFGAEHGYGPGCDRRVLRPDLSVC